MIDSTAYINTFTELKKELEVLRDNQSVLSMFNQESTTDELVREVIFKYLNPVGEANLSNKLYDPAQLKHEIATMVQKPFFVAAEANFTYEDLLALKKNVNIYESNVAQIVKKPDVQASHYLFQGTQLLDDYSTAPPPATAFNFILDQGADNLGSSLARPIGVTQLTGTPNTWQSSVGAWSSYANMVNDLNTLISSLVEKNFNTESTVVLYPKFAIKSMNKKRTTTGDGFRNAFMELEDLGIPRSRVLPIDNIFMKTLAGEVPNNGAFDLYALDLSKIKILNTLQPFVNIYSQNDGRRFPTTTVECGRGFIPLFIPEYNPSDKKIYKGVSIVRAINGV